MATKRLHDEAQKEREADCMKVHCNTVGTLQKESGRTIQLNREAAPPLTWQTHKQNKNYIFIHLKSFNTRL